MSTYDAYNLSLRDSTEFVVPQNGDNSSSKSEVTVNPSVMLSFIAAFLDHYICNYYALPEAEGNPFIDLSQENTYARLFGDSEHTSGDCSFSIDIDPEDFELTDDSYVPERFIFVAKILDYNDVSGRDRSLFTTVIGNYIFYIVITQETDGETGDVGWFIRENPVAYNLTTGEKITGTIVP